MSTVLGSSFRLMFCRRRGVMHLQARRRRVPGVIPPLTFLLGWALLPEFPRSDLPGNKEQETPISTCPCDGSVMIVDEDGTAYCQEKGHFFEHWPRTE